MTNVYRDEIIEQCAVAAEAQDRTGYEWVRNSLWDAILRRAGENVRALKSRPLIASELPDQNYDDTMSALRDALNDEEK